MTVRRAVIPAALLLAALVAACGSDGDGADPAPTTAADATTATTTTSGASAADAAGAIEVVVADGEVVGGVQRVNVTLGTEVVLRVTSDVSDEIHVHGYDHFTDVAAGSTAEVRFVADIPGVFEVELESAGLKILELEVAP